MSAGVDTGRRCRRQSPRPGRTVGHYAGDRTRGCRLERPLIADRDIDYVVTVDRTRRLAVRADTFPETATRTVDDVLVIPSDLSDVQSHQKAEDAVFKWTLRKVAVGSEPDVTFEQSVDAYKLFWIAARPDGDIIVDSVRGTNRR